ncbi:hypothetical protein CERSUDRAFT_89132 [Gelatoporia subvermispora B]|uniref:Carboxypeptidase n=1 Tax=Ceriporiopsis subvermispora (strain B) TaxID=914234 RepID=M2QXL5_CERS8|nr:hypothetical protein CERSUDRAFT_89132 [Gelatoporia subvermispora B]
MELLAALLAVLAICTSIRGQVEPVPATLGFPHEYPGIPSGSFSTQWQSYYEVTDPLPNVSFSLPHSYAGNIPVNRPGHPNDTLFFWGFDKKGTNGSLANANSTDPWLLWLNGGPGSSSMIGLFTEHGPIHVLANNTLVSNEFAWTNLVDAIYVDQPVGTGFSTADATGFIADEDQMADDFLGFLTNLVAIFPGLASRPLYLTGESYAGTYIPYITKGIFSAPNPPVNLRRIAMGDGAIGSLAAFEELPALNVIETYPQIIGYDTDVFDYFKEQEHLCGFDLNFTYPQQGGTFPSLQVVEPTDRETDFVQLYATGRKSLLRSIASKYYAQPSAGSLSARDVTPEVRMAKREQWKRDLSGRANGTIDPWYGCFLFDEITDYAVNFSFPWTGGEFDVYDIPDGTAPEPDVTPFDFLNNDKTRTALHAPTSMNWSYSIEYPFENSPADSNEFGDPSVEPMAFLTELASNASARNVSIVFYSGNDDSLVNHRGTEVVIQNMTFGGIQGFTRPPSTPWFNDDGSFAGIVHQERNVTYVLFQGAGHLVAQWQPAAALTFLREFILGSNQTGLVTNSGVVGGENASFTNDVLPGGDEFFFGSSSTAGTTTVPLATQQSWASFLATAVPTASIVGSGAAAAQTSSSASGACSLAVGKLPIFVVLFSAFSLLLLL